MGHLRRWIGKITSHGIDQLSDAEHTWYGVTVNIELEREPGRFVDVKYSDPEEAEMFGLSMVRMALTARKHTVELAAGRFINEGGQTDVHTEHCCDRHGCKYGEDELCSVMNGSKPQSHLCEQCEHELTEADAMAKEILRMRNERAQIRREAKAER